MIHPRNYVFALIVVSAIAAPGFAQSDSDRIAMLEHVSATGTATQLELAHLYVKVGRFYEASKVAKGVLAAEPSNSEAQAILDEATAGMRDVQSRKTAEADALVARGNLTPEERLSVATAYFEGGRYLAAADAYAHLPAAMRTPEVKLRQARALAWAGRLDDAEKLYAELDRGSTDPALSLEYARLLSWMGASKLATERLERIYRENPDEETVVALANAKAWSGDREGALALLDSFAQKNPSAAQAAALRNEIATGPELRIEKIDRMIEVEPYNLALRVDRARLLIDAGRFSEALQTLRFVKEHSRKPVAGVAELERKAKEGRDAQIAALKSQRKTLDVRDPANDEAAKKLAESYTGAGDYKSAAKLYESYLSRHPDDTDARIHYARVLNWDRRYAAAENQYRIILDKNPERADIRYEYAQVLEYQEDYVPAMHTFRGLTDLSSNPRAHLYGDVPEKAHFNLGQIYRWFGWNEHALAEQNSALALDSAYAPARQELDLVRHLRPATHLDGTYTYAEDSSDFRLKQLTFEGEKATSQRTSWTALVGHDVFERRGDEVSANTFAVGGKYRWQDRWTARGRIGINSYSDGLGTRPYWALGAQFLPSIQSLFSVDYNHYDLVYDVFTIESLRQKPIDIDDFRAHYDYKTGGHLAYLADASYGFISDDNNRKAAHGLLTYRILKAPYVALKADGRYLSYDFRTNRYWSPNDYRSLAGVLQVGSNIRERLFWQAELKYGRSWEDGRQSDLRAIETSATLPVNDRIDLVGDYAYGRSGRLDSILGNNGTDLVNYWQRRWYVGFRLKKLFDKSDRQHDNDRYYFDDSRVDSSIIPPLGERR